jgi:hypothetical protein
MLTFLLLLNKLMGSGIITGRAGAALYFSFISSKLPAVISTPPDLCVT